MTHSECARYRIGWLFQNRRHRVDQIADTVESAKWAGQRGENSIATDCPDGFARGHVHPFDSRWNIVHQTVINHFALFVDVEILDGYGGLKGLESTNSVHC